MVPVSFPYDKLSKSTWKAVGEKVARRPADGTENNILPVPTEYIPERF